MQKAIIITAGNMSDETYERLCSGILEKFGKDIEFEHREQPEIIGGFILHINGTVYDLSLGSQLDGLKRHINE